MSGDSKSNEFDLVMEREIDAPRELVWAAWTDEAQLKEWWGPKGFTNRVCRADARQGGKIYIEMLAPDGTVYPMSGVYEELEEPGRIVFGSTPLDAEGKTLFAMRTTVTLTAQGGKTTLRLEANVLDMTSPMAPHFLAGMKQGWGQSLDRLSALVTAAG